MPSVGPKLFRSLFHIPPFEKLTVVAGSIIASATVCPLLSTGTNARLLSSRTGLKYSHFTPARTVTFGFQRQLSWMYRE